MNQQLESEQSKAPTFVVGVDYSENSELAFDQCVRFASNAPGVKLHVVNAQSGELPDETGLVVTQTSEEDLEQLVIGLEAWVDRRFQILEAAGYGIPDLLAIVHVISGPAGRAILELSREVEADLIFVGTHGRTGLGRILFGSVADTVVRGAPCGVMVCRPRIVQAELELAPPPLEGQGSSLGRRHNFSYRGKNAERHENLPLLFPMR